jgi:hypothetical protein
MAYFLQIVLPGLPNPKRKIFRKEKLHWQESIKNAVNGRTPEKPLGKAHVSFTRYSDQPIDFDNLVGSFAQIMNCLVRVGIIVDDTWSVVGKPEYNHKIVARKSGKIKITVCDPDGQSGSCFPY